MATVEIDLEAIESETTPQNGATSGADAAESVPVPESPPAEDMVPPSDAATDNSWRADEPVSDRSLPAVETDLGKEGAKLVGLAPVAFLFALAVILVAGVAATAHFYQSGGSLAPPLYMLTISGGGLAILWRAFLDARRLRQTLQAEPSEVGLFGARGLSLGDALGWLHDRRVEHLEAFEGGSAALANLLIVLGMIGTTFYLVTNADSFQVGENDKLDLNKLLSIAPKAFGTTGLSLLCAAAINLAAATARRRAEALAPRTIELLEAWELGRTAEGRDDARHTAQLMADALGQKLDELPRALQAMARESNGAVRSMEAVLRQMHEASVRFVDVSKASDEVLLRLRAATDSSSQVLARIDETEKNLADTMRRASEQLSGILQDHQREMLANTAQRAPQLFLDAMKPASDGFSQLIDRQTGVMLDALRSASVGAIEVSGQRLQDIVRMRSEEVELLRAQVEQLSDGLHRMGLIVKDAATQWAPAAEVAGSHLRRFTEAITDLSNGGKEAPKTVQELTIAMERAADRLGESVGRVTSQSRALGEIDAILGKGGRT